MINPFYTGNISHSLTKQHYCWLKFIKKIFFKWFSRELDFSRPLNIITLSSAYYSFLPNLLSLIVWKVNILIIPFIVIINLMIGYGHRVISQLSTWLASSTCLSRYSFMHSVSLAKLTWRSPSLSRSDHSQYFFVSFLDA